MQLIISTIITILEQSFIYGILALGSYISYKILNFPDLSVQGIFPLGAAITSIMIVNGFNPFLTLFVSILAGFIAGALTGIIHVKLKISDILSGIIVLTALLSLNLLIPGKSNIPLMAKQTIFTIANLAKINPALSFISKAFLAFVIFVIVKKLLDLFFKTRAGYLLKAAGDNETFVVSLAKDVGIVKILGLALANSLVALAGSIYCQWQNSYDVNMGVNVVVIGLASVILGINIFKRLNKITRTTKVVFGCIVYHIFISIAINFNVQSNVINLVIAILFLIALLFNKRDLNFPAFLRRKKND